MKNINRICCLLACMLMCLASCDVIEEPYLVGAEEAKEILEFKVDTIAGVIDQSRHTITLDFPAGTDVSHLAPTIVVSTYAKVSPASGVAQDFSNPVVYKVTAFDGSTVDYQVIAVVHDEENEKSILSFRVDDPACEGVIDEALKTVVLTFPFGTDVTMLTPVIQVSEGASVMPASGEVQDFTSPVTYTVTAMNGTTVAYVVTAVVQGPFLDPTGKTVLLHDYTGVRCVNCPAAAEIAHQLQEQYGERLIVMSVHAGAQSNPYNNNPDFRTEDGTTWYNGNNSNPLGSVNRAMLVSGYTLQASTWADQVAEAFVEPQTVEIRISNAYDATTKQLTASIEALELERHQGELALTVCMIENGIVAKQLTPSGPVADYVHQHVFRATLNGTYGETIHFKEEDQYLFNKSFSYTLPDEFNADNCYVIAYIYDNSDNMKVIQTAIQKVN